MGWSVGRYIAEIGGRPIAFVEWKHGPRDEDPDRHSELGVWLDRADLDVELLTFLWQWVTDQAAAGGSRAFEAYAVEDESEMLAALARVGYRRDRLEKVWELDLRKHGKRLREEADGARQTMKAAGIDLVTLTDWDDPEKFRKVHALNELTLPDAPHTFPILPQTFYNFMERLNGPDRPHDRFWVATEGERAVALSYLSYPPVRGSVWTGFTCCHPDHRGRGVARAVKLQSLAQAVELGIPSVFTDNDSQNAPMLHINEKLGYQPRPGFVGLVMRVEP